MEEERNPRNLSWGMEDVETWCDDDDDVIVNCHCHCHWWEDADDWIPFPVPFPVLFPVPFPLPFAVPFHFPVPVSYPSSVDHDWEIDVCVVVGEWKDWVMVQVGG